MNRYFNGKKRKDFLNHYDNSKYRRSRGMSDYVATSATKLNIHVLELLLYNWCNHLPAINYEQLKWMKTIMGNWYWLQLMHLSQVLKKNGHYTSREMTKWFCNKTMLGHMLQTRWKPIWKYLNGTSYQTRHIHQTLYHPIITGSNRWHMAWLSSTFILILHKNAQKWVDSRSASKDISFFWHEIQMLPERWEKVMASYGQYFQ